VLLGGKERKEQLTVLLGMALFGEDGGKRKNAVAEGRPREDERRGDKFHRSNQANAGVRVMGPGVRREKEKEEEQ